MTLPAPPPLTDHYAVFLDFDGTLAALQDDADSVGISRARAELLVRFAARQQGAVALISGRDVRDLASRTPRELMRIGNHGLYRLLPGETVVSDIAALPDALKSAMERMVSTKDGAFLEVKGPVGTVHFRACPEHGPSLIDSVKTAAASCYGYRSKVGNHVVEAIPDGANKGVALEKAMASTPFKGRIPVMVGDDTTDEDGFLAAQRLGGYGVKVGRGATVARKTLRDVDAVWNWLEASL